MNINREYKFLSSWSGKKLAKQINELALNGFAVETRYTAFKHTCWMSRITETDNAKLV